MIEAKITRKPNGEREVRIAANGNIPQIANDFLVLTRAVFRAIRDDSNEQVARHVMTLLAEQILDPESGLFDLSGCHFPDPEDGALS